MTLWELALDQIARSGLLGALLVLSLGALYTTITRFVRFLESLDARHAQERKEWREELAEHTRISAEMYSVLREMHEDLRRRNGRYREGA